MFGGGNGATGRFVLSTGEPGIPKRQLYLDSDVEATAHMPGGAGYGDPLKRDPELVLQDVILGFVTPEAAEREYGVKIACSKRPDERIGLPEHYAIDRDATRRLREGTR